MFRVKSLELGVKSATLLLLLFLFAPALFAQQPDTVQQGNVKEVTIEFVKPTVQTFANVTTISTPQIKAQ